METGLENLGSRLTITSPISEGMIAAGYDAMRDADGVPPDNWVLGYALKVFIAMIEAGVREGCIQTEHASAERQGEAIVTDEMVRAGIDIIPMHSYPEISNESGHVSLSSRHVTDIYRAMRALAPDCGIKKLGDCGTVQYRVDAVLAAARARGGGMVSTKPGAMQQAMQQAMGEIAVEGAKVAIRAYETAGELPRETPSDVAVYAAAEAIWNCRDARMGGPFRDLDPRTFAAVHALDTARAALRAAYAWDASLNTDGTAQEVSPHDVTLSPLPDADRLDFLQAAALKSRTGISFDYVPSIAGHSGGWRFMRKFYVGNPSANLRAAIDAAYRHPDVAR